MRLIFYKVSITTLPFQQGRSSRESTFQEQADLRLAADA